MSADTSEQLLRYRQYLLALQEEYREILEFCYDEDFYPHILGQRYQAITKRDEYTDGKITPEELTEWMETSFPNRKPRKAREEVSG